MPPKVDKGQQKALEKQKVKIAEDKTFGLKNKNKSKSVQKFIKGVQSAAKGSNISDQVLRQQENEQKEKKKQQLQQAALMASLFKGTENIKKLAENGKRSDPQSIKADQAIDVYTDQREQRTQDTMDSWDIAKLEEVVKTKHGGSESKPTDIVCKFFLDALEKRQYGWFWTCPSGGDSCKYRHCLPPGYVLRREAIADDDIDEEDAEPIEDIIERERAALPQGGTKVTLETFKAWKAKKEQDRVGAVEAARVAEIKKSGGTGLHVLSGRDLFSYDPTLFIDDAAAADEDDYQEDGTYWNGIVNENQAIVDAANKAAREKQTDEGSVDDTDKTTDGQDDVVGTPSVVSAAVQRKDVFVASEKLFLEDVPDLDELDD